MTVNVTSSINGFMILDDMARGAPGVGRNGIVYIKAACLRSTISRSL